MGVKAEYGGKSHAGNESHDRKTDCKMIARNLNVITFRSLHTHFQVSAASLAREIHFRALRKKAAVEGTKYLPKSESEVATSETSERVANSKHYCRTGGRARGR